MHLRPKRWLWYIGLCPTPFQRLYQPLVELLLTIVHPTKLKKHKAWYKMHNAPTAALHWRHGFAYLAPVGALALHILHHLVQFCLLPSTWWYSFGSPLDYALVWYTFAPMHIPHKLMQFKGTEVGQHFQRQDSSEVYLEPNV